MCITHVFANKQFGPTNVGINTFITTMLLALTTSYDGGALLRTQGTHICLILSLILHGSKVAFINPNMRRDMVPWSISRMMDLPPSAKLREMLKWATFWSPIPPKCIRLKIKNSSCAKCASGC